MAEYKTVELDEMDIKKLISEKYGIESWKIKMEIVHGDPQYPEDHVYWTFNTT